MAKNMRFELTLPGAKVLLLEGDNGVELHVKAGSASAAASLSRSEARALAGTLTLMGEDAR